MPVTYMITDWQRGHGANVSRLLSELSLSTGSYEKNLAFLSVLNGIVSDIVLLFVGECHEIQLDK